MATQNIIKISRRAHDTLRRLSYNQRKPIIRIIDHLLGLSIK